jgi:hypothetical protein
MLHAVDMRPACLLARIADGVGAGHRQLCSFTIAYRSATNFSPADGTLLF